MIQILDKTFETFIAPEKIQEEILTLANQINRDYAGKDVIFIAVLNGSFMFAADLFKKISIPCEISFVKVSSYHGTNTSGRVDELIGLNTDITDKHVIVLEDIVDTGITIDKIFTLLRSHQPSSVKIATLLYKPDAFKGKNAPHYIGFTIPNAFVVGYGLDYNEKGRNLEAIYQLKGDVPKQNTMLNIVLFGPPGAGKGTQSERLIQKYGLVHLSTGDMFRMHIAEDTELGKRVKQILADGMLVPDSITIDMLEEECQKHPDAKGFIFDGFPRTVVQANALDEYLAGKGQKINAVLQLDVPEEVIKERIALRREVSGRADDDAVKLLKRIDEYFTKTIHVLPYYQEQNKVSKIDGVGEIDNISALLYASIDSHLV